MLTFWKSISMTFTGGNARTNNEKRVAYSRLASSQDTCSKNNENFYKTTLSTSSKSSYELTNNNTNTNTSKISPSASGSHTSDIMKHSVSMDWKMGTVLSSHSHSQGSSLKEMQQNKTENVKELFHRVQCHSKFLSSVIFNDEGSDISDMDDDDDKGFMCEVCERTFPTAKGLAVHQDKKRHFGCLECDSIFPSRENLECHREQMGHFDFGSDYGSDTTYEYDSDEEDLLQDQDQDDEDWDHYHRHSPSSGFKANVNVNVDFNGSSFV